MALVERSTIDSIALEIFWHWNMDNGISLFLLRKAFKVYTIGIIEMPQSEMKTFGKSQDDQVINCFSRKNLAL